LPKCLIPCFENLKTYLIIRRTDHTDVSSTRLCFCTRAKPKISRKTQQLTTTCFMVGIYNHQTMLTPTMRISTPHLLVCYLALSFLQDSVAWTSKEVVNRRNILEFAGWSTLATFAPPSVAEEATASLGLQPVESAATGDAKKVRLFFPG
jgi:hypothetical protein